MTQMQKSQYEVMLAQALINNIHICGKGTIKKTGQTFYAVTSSNGVDCYHIIVDGNSLICNCKAGQCGKYCSHRALVRAAITEAATKPAPVVASTPTRLNETFRNGPSMADVMNAMRPVAGA